jgi:hypothetical protein
MFSNSNVFGCKIKIADVVDKIFIWRQNEELKFLRKMDYYKLYP